MPRHVTAGVDSSPESLAAAHWAAREAALRDARLLLVHVEEWPLPLAVAAPTIDRDDHRSWAHRLLDAAAAEVRARHPDAEVTTRLLSGRPPAALAVEAAGSELLVLGSRGLGTVAGALMGSVGTAVIGATEVPVVVVRAGKGGERAREVVAGVDLDPGTDAVLAFAFAAAGRRDVALRVVHAAKVPLFHAHAPAHRERAAAEAAAALGAALAPWRERFPAVAVTERAVPGAAAQVLVEEAAGALLVVTGRRIRRAPVVPHIGHVTHAVMHHCTAPVAVVAHA
ncbi:universal stress protein [Streptomyces zhihengii]